MKQILLRGGLPLLAMVTLTGCFDDNYDLSDIDTTSEFKVKDLVLPLNLDPVTLGDIIEIKDGEQIKEITLNGETFYAVQENGTFESDEIEIPGFKTNEISVNPTNIDFKIPTVPSIPDVDIDVNIDPINLSFSEFISQENLNKEISFTATDIDDAIVEITDIYANNFEIKLDFKIDDTLATCAEIEITDLIITLPKGLVIDEIEPAVGQGEGYDSQTGILKISALKLSNGAAVLSLKASMISLEDNNCGIDYDTHSLELETEVSISDVAVLSITPEISHISSLPTEATLNITYTITPLDVAAVSGTINYKLDGMNISPVSLTSLPDFLSGDETNLVLANPQIYLSVNNPVAGDKLGYSTGLNITATRTSGNQDFKLNSNIEVGYDQGVAGPYQFCLSPKDPSAKPEEYSAAKHIAYTQLSEVISGDGLPESLEINLIDPQIYEQKVEKFELGRNLPRLEGQWDFLAPLAMAEGTDSKIVYNDVVDGWSSDDLDKVVIQKLEVNLNITNNTPLQAEISGYPIDKNGRKINDVEIEGATIPGNAVNSPVTIKINGEIRNLDGIEFTATVKPQSDNALSPNQSITLSDIRVKVSGNYTTDF